uniref:NADH-ubiquinone oxidoreductase chain 2 n=1 Tax=Pseudophyllus titan TaxID=1982315 RepID=A0A1W6QZI7_9ORTH|nr:NADH dehydrogenase subunit 2 [Pseudophyllus titan]ARO46874.1 NADH dehydrogenase subunit 2 [Pseudophyllus titan]
MIMNPSKYLFIMTLISGTFITISATSWLGIWLGLEINLLSFILLMIHPKNSMSTEASLKYFLIQAFASSILLFSFILTQLTIKMNLLTYQETLFILLNSSVLLKMGSAPFHFWLPGTMEGLSWLNCLILTTWQKIAPLMIISYLIEFNLFMITIIILSIITGSLGGLNQTSIRKMMAYSSINHAGWMLSGMLSGENLWLIYFSIYFLLNMSVMFIFHIFQISYISQNYLILNSKPSLKFYLYSLLLSLGGLPPFLGFMPKWLIIENLTNLNQLFLTTFMIIMTLITLFYYIRLTFSAFLLNPLDLKWNLMTNYNSSSLVTTASMTINSFIGLIIFATLLTF